MRVAEICKYANQMWRKMIIILLISNDWAIYKENNMTYSLQPYQAAQGITVHDLGSSQAIPQAWQIGRASCRERERCVPVWWGTRFRPLSFRGQGDRVVDCKLGYSLCTWLSHLILIKLIIIFLHIWLTCLHISATLIYIRCRLIIIGDLVSLSEANT